MPGITDYRRYEKIIASSPLFSGFAAGELESIIKCLSPSVRVIEKDGTVFSHGDRPQYVGIVLDGCVYVVYDDYFVRRRRDAPRFRDYEKGKHRASDRQRKASRAVRVDMQLSCAAHEKYDKDAFGEKYRDHE